MRKKTLCAFEDYLPAGLRAHTSEALAEILGQGDQLALHAAIDNIVPAGTNTVKFDVFVEHCADGCSWVQRKSGATTVGNGDISLSWAPAAVADTHVMWSDACMVAGTPDVGPLLPYVRLRVQVTAASAHVTIHATLRDLD
ncbi:MAG TPA: hypothetical protein VHB21_09470 [Minicystis sp.]|nr:hypothetical protein [Minicystis sp.]